MLRILLFFVGVFAYGFFASSDIAANWMMDECNWSNGVIDSSLNRNDGVAYNGANTDSMGVVCRSGYFIADNKNYVEINNSSSLSVNTLTYMAWIKLDDPNYDRNKDGLENIFTIIYKNQNLKEVGSGEFKGVEVNLSDFNETKRGVKLFR